MRITAAPEDFRKLLPVIGSSSRVTVPNLLGLDILPMLPRTWTEWTTFGTPFVNRPLVLDGEFGNLSYLADLAAADIHLVAGLGFSVPKVFVTAQDPPGGPVVSKGSTVRLKLRVASPS